jgi:hypothetical protein
MNIPVNLTFLSVLPTLCTMLSSPNETNSWKGLLQKLQFTYWDFLKLKDTELNFVTAFHLTNIIDNDFTLFVLDS